VSTRLDKLNIDDETLTGVLDFLPYPFLVSEFRNSKRYNVFVNQKFLEEIGYTCEEIPTNEDWFKMAYPNPTYRQEVKEEWASRSLQAQKADEEFVFLRALIHTKMNGDRWYEVKSSVSGSSYLVSFIDIHEVLAREEELERANRNKDKILSILGHDLRSPIKNLHNLSMLALNASITKEEFLTTVARINDSAFQSLEFLDTTLLWTKSNFNKLSINIEKIAPRALVDKIMPLYRSLYEIKKITLSVDIQARIFIHSDVEILTIVIRNLISNAIKFTNESGAINISTEQGEGFFFIVVRDSGIGIDKQTLKSILENQYAPMKGTQQEMGIGLGLKLCKELLVHINGALEIESKPSEGTTVKIKLKNNIEDY
jgi:signal transduction histidine kinase